MLDFIIACPQCSAALREKDLQVDDTDETLGVAYLTFYCWRCSWKKTVRIEYYVPDDEPINYDHYDDATETWSD